jgi:hypothetical protein
MKCERFTAALLHFGLLGLVACADPKVAPRSDDTTGDSAETGEPAEIPAETPITPLPPGRLLRRMSLDLRGTLPSLDEYAAVEADPTVLPSLRDAMLEDLRFEQRLVHRFAEIWRTRVDVFLVLMEEYAPLRDTTREFDFERAVADEPLRLMARVAAADLPWSTVVTADWTMAHPITLSIWPVETSESPDPTGWARAAYTDGRPAAGVLATNGLWIRYPTSDTNYNRMRAAIISELLVCEDYLRRPVQFTGGFEGAPDEALRTDPYCQGCHASLDPVAGALMGFLANPYNIDETAVYHGEREVLSESLLGVSPAWQGTPVSGLAALGQAIAADPRFSRCAVETLARSYWRRDLSIGDFDGIEAHRQDFEAEDLRLKSLIRRLTDDPHYQAGSGSGEITRRLVPPEILESALADALGLSWTRQGTPLLQDDVWGFRILGGGMDGELVSRPADLPNLSHAAVVQRLSEATARSALRDGRIDATLRPEDPAFATQLGDLAHRLWGAPLTESESGALTTLWTDLATVSDAETAWAGVLVALIQDMEMVSQ